MITMIYLDRVAIVDGDPAPIVVREKPDGPVDLFASVEINGPSKLVYDPSIKEGPRVWIETEAEVLGTR